MGEVLRTCMSDRRGRLFPCPIKPHRLLKYSKDHVAYEMDMLTKAALWPAVDHLWPAEVTPAHYPEHFKLLQSIRVEIFGVHLRNLIVFLYPDAFDARADDVSAHHFLPRGASPEPWLKARPPLSPTLAAAKKRADKELAHLTKLRIPGTPKYKHWVFAPLLGELHKVLCVFVEYADPDRLAPEARAAVPMVAAARDRLMQS